MTTRPDQPSKTYDVIVERGVRVPTRDGAFLVTDIFRPALGDRPVEGRFPVLLCRTPYGRARWDQDGYFFARHGYVQALQDWRQTQGEFDMSSYKPKFEETDGYDAVEWLARQPWSNGKVGAWGHSANGQVVQSILAAAPPSFASAFVIDSGLDYGAYPARQNGAFGLAMRLRHCLKMALQLAEEAHVRQVLQDAYRDAPKYFALFRRPQAAVVKGTTVLALAPHWEERYIRIATTADLDDPFWKVSGAGEDIDQWMDVPTCFVTGWYGNHASANFDKYRALRGRLKNPVRLLVGHWDHTLDTTHTGGVDFGPDSDIDMFWSQRLRWFDETLRGVDGGETAGPGIRYFVMGGGDGRVNADGRMNQGGRWAGADTWPPEGTQPVAFYLSGDGTLASTPPEAEVSSTTFTFDPRDPVPTVGGNFMEFTRPDFASRVDWMPEGGARDQRANAAKPHCRDSLPLATREDVLVFQTAPLEADVTVTGELLARLWVSSTAPDTDFTVKLIDVHPPNPDFPEGFAMNLQDAVVRMRYRNGRRTPELIVPGRVYEVTLPFHSTANLFRKGHRIRVDVSSSNFPRVDVNLNNGGPLGVPGPVRIAENTLHHDSEHPSHVVLPVVRQPKSAAVTP